MPNLDECIKEAFRYMKRAETELANENYEIAMIYSSLAQNYLTMYIAIKMAGPDENAIPSDNLS